MNIMLKLYRIYIIIKNCIQVVFQSQNIRDNVMFFFKKLFMNKDNALKKKKKKKQKEEEKNKRKRRAVSMSYASVI